MEIDTASRTSGEEQLCAAYSNVDDPAEAFADLVKLSTESRVASPFNVGRAGEPRLLDAPGNGAKVYVCPPDSPVAAESPWVIYRKSDGVWWLTLY